MALKVRRSVAGHYATAAAQHGRGLRRTARSAVAADAIRYNPRPVIDASYDFPLKRPVVRSSSPP
jgi:hypothetical protein